MELRLLVGSTHVNWVRIISWLKIFAWLYYAWDKPKLLTVTHHSCVWLLSPLAPSSLCFPWLSLYRFLCWLMLFLKCSRHCLTLGSLCMLFSLPSMCFPQLLSSLAPSQHFWILQETLLTTHSGHPPPEAKSQHVTMSYSFFLIALLICLFPLDKMYVP